MHTTIATHLTLLTFVFVCVAGCGDTTANRLGAQKERCFADNDCRDGFVCLVGSCQNPADFNGLGNTSDSTGTSSTSNGTGTSNPTSNGTSNTSNGTSATSNGTSGTNNGTTSTSNSTTATSNGTSSTSNGTTATSNGTVVDPELVELCDRFCDIAPVCLGAVEEGCRAQCEMTRGSNDAFANFVDCITVLSCEEARAEPGRLCFEILNEANNRFVLLEDLSERVSRGTPGADIDAISVTLTNGTEYFATTVEDFNVDQRNNNWPDPVEALGPPNANCQLTKIVSLGGIEADGYVIVGFSTAAEEIMFGTGSVIRVYELGPSSCPEQVGWIDDPFAISISTRTDEFVEIGVGGGGRSAIRIP